MNSLDLTGLLNPDLKDGFPHNMKTLMITASAFGNTARIASAIEESLAQHCEVKSICSNDFAIALLDDHELIIVGSPTQKFYPLPEITALLKAIPQKSLSGKAVVAFDTRFTAEEIAKVKILDFMVKFFGYAAPSIGKLLGKKGGKLLTPPIGFYVGGLEGPLLNGELDRARLFGSTIYTEYDKKTH